MRIAVSGTHCSGKSTLVEDFIAVHPDYPHEPEPYEWLVELHGEAIAAQPDAADFYRQLEVSVERLRAYPPGSRMIAERSPLDFLAYLRALEAAELIEAASELAWRGMKQLDLLVVLPLDAADGIVAPESEGLELREAMNDHLLEIISEGWDLQVIEVRGAPERRLRALELAMAG